jgi:hypothetical protein
MATILSSKVFEGTYDANMLEDIGRWLAKAVGGEKCRRFKLLLETVDTSRQKKMSLRKTLEALAADGEFNWKQGEYDFRFMAGGYFWKGQEVYLTAGEELFLYRSLILKEAHPQQLSYRRNMRKRLGKDFMVDVWGENGKA